MGVRGCKTLNTSPVYIAVSNFTKHSINCSLTGVQNMKVSATYKFSDKCIIFLTFLSPFLAAETKDKCTDVLNSKF